MMDFGNALVALRLGNKVSREGWNGKGMWLFLVKDWQYTQAAPTEMPSLYSSQSFIAMRTAGELNSYVPWLASQPDILAYDWSIVP